MDTNLRFNYHFEPKKGWMNDPNGLIYFRGRYHAFFQHNPHSAQWGPMHWGHAVSDDLVHWEELPIALYPDREYENAGGCFSGSAIEKDGRLYLIYTSVSHELKQTQSIAYSDDGVNPVAEARHLLTKTSRFVCVEGSKLIISDRLGGKVVHEIPERSTVEIFVDGGAMSFSRWLD